MVRSFIAKEIAPHHEQWEKDGIVSRDVWLAAGRQGLLGIDIDERYGGGGNTDYRYYLVLGVEGFERGRNLDKVGLHAQDTAELFFDNVRVPRENLLGEEGMGFIYLMQNLARERLSIGATALAGAEAAFEQTLEYSKSREAF